MFQRFFFPTVQSPSTRTQRDCAELRNIRLYTLQGLGGNIEDGIPSFFKSLQLHVMVYEEWLVSGRLSGAPRSNIEDALQATIRTIHPHPEAREIFRGDFSMLRSAALRLVHVLHVDVRANLRIYRGDCVRS